LPETQGSHKASGILDRIVRTKEEEIKALLPMEGLFRQDLLEAPPPRMLFEALSRPGEVALMAEIKRRSPGAGSIRPDLVPSRMAVNYERKGAAAISVLTDSQYFGGSLDDLREVRASVEIPVFRKDFLIHEVQLLEARAAGADGVLLIARILSSTELKTLHAQAVELGLTPLVEVHGMDEVEKALEAGASIVGINNRNLQTFETSLDTTLHLLPLIPPDVVVVSESGIGTADEVDRLGAAGVQGILVGETILRAPDPGVVVRELSGRNRVAR
jgi:indole-3-glycerol phosphate synthase